MKTTIESANNYSKFLLSEVRKNIDSLKEQQQEPQLTSEAHLMKALEGGADPTEFERDHGSVKLNHLIDIWGSARSQYELFKEYEFETSLFLAQQAVGNFVITLDEYDPPRQK